MKIIALFCLALALTQGLPARGGPDAPATPQAVWADFDPRAEPLDAEVLKRWTDSGANFTEFYFTGMTNGTNKVRVYAIYSAPVGGSNLPAILHIHGGGQTVNQNWLRFWNQRGYAALSFNWGGEWTNRPKFTRWGNLKQGNHASSGRMMQTVEPSVRDSSWYLWTRISRRALTALESQPEVDAKSLGIFGVSMGGTIVWPFAAMDRRVKAACAIYGVGWNTYPDELPAPDPKAGDSSIKLWRATMEPEAYAPLVNCPILFLDASNDQHGKLDWAFRTLNVVPAKCRWVFTPRYRHHIAGEQENDLPLWMDAWLKGAGPTWPTAPSATVTLDPTGIPRLTVAPDSPSTVERVDLFYALENPNPKNRFWRSARGQRASQNWTALLPILEANQPLFAYANVYYKSGISLSSSLVTVVPARLGAVKPTDTASLLIDDFAQETGDWTALYSDTDPIPPVPCLLTNAFGPDGIRGITVTRRTPLATYKVGDPKWRGPDEAKLQFKAFTPVARQLRIVMHENEGALGARDFTAKRPLIASLLWQDVTLSARDFKDGEGKPLSNWRQVKMLEIDVASHTLPQPVYSQFRWLR